MCNENEATNTAVRQHGLPVSFLQLSHPHPTSGLSILPLMPAVSVRRIACLDMLLSLAGLVDGSRLRFTFADQIAKCRSILMYVFFGSCEYCCHDMFFEMLTCFSLRGNLRIIIKTRKHYFVSRWDFLFIDK